MRAFALTIFMLLVSLCAFSEESARGAVIEMDTTSYDFGRVSRRGGTLSHTFTLRNVGRDALVITDVTTTCTCLKAKHPRRPIAPNAEAEIEVKYDLQRKEVGAFHKVIKIISNSTNGNQLLTIHGFSEEE